MIMRNKNIESNEIAIESGMKIVLPPEFVEFWNLSVGDCVVVYKGRETVMLLPQNRSTRKKQIRGTISLAEQLLAMIEKSEKPMELEQLLLPNRSRSTTRGRLSELHKSGRIDKVVKKGVSYYIRK